MESIQDVICEQARDIALYYVVSKNIQSSPPENEFLKRLSRLLTTILVIPSAFTNLLAHIQKYIHWFATQNSDYIASLTA